MKTLNTGTAAALNIVANHGSDDQARGLITMLKDLILGETDQVLRMSDGYRIAILDDGSVIAGCPARIKAGLSTWWTNTDIFSLAFVRDILVGLWTAIKAVIALVIAPFHALYVYVTTKTDGESKVDAAVASVVAAGTVVAEKATAIKAAVVAPVVAVPEAVVVKPSSEAKTSLEPVIVPTVVEEPIVVTPAPVVEEPTVVDNTAEIARVYASFLLDVVALFPKRSEKNQAAIADALVQYRTDGTMVNGMKKSVKTFLAVHPTAVTGA